MIHTCIFEMIKKMDFKTYQQKYVGFLKSMTKTRMLGILSRELFCDYPENLPKKYQKQMYQETLFMKDKQVPKPEKFSPYIRHTMQLHYLEMLNINFLHKLGQDKHKEFLETNPQITEVINEEYIEDLQDTNISYEEFIELMQSKSPEIQKMQTKAAKNERMQKAWLFDRWLLYQEVIVVMSLIESFLRESYDIYIDTFRDIVDISDLRSDSDDICFSKLLRYFMNEELNLEQRFGPKNVRFLLDFWIRRCAIIHNNGVINERSLRRKGKTDLKLGEQVIIDNKNLDKLYSIISNLQRIIYKKLRLANEKNKV